MPGNLKEGAAAGGGKELTVTVLVTLPKIGIQVICYVLRKKIFEIGLLPE
jgi:hypothetical protein